MLSVLKEDVYGYARVPEHTERIEYGRFRNVYLYITEKCQLCCGHCYMGERLENGKFMPTPEAYARLSKKSCPFQHLSYICAEP